MVVVVVRVDIPTGTITIPEDTQVVVMDLKTIQNPIPTGMKTLGLAELKSMFPLCVTSCVRLRPSVVHLS